MQTVNADILADVAKIVDLAMAREYVKANDWYLRMSIGMLSSFRCTLQLSQWFQAMLLGQWASLVSASTKGRREPRSFPTKLPVRTNQLVSLVSPNHVDLLC